MKQQPREIQILMIKQHLEEELLTYNNHNYISYFLKIKAR